MDATKYSSPNPCKAGEPPALGTPPLIDMTKNNLLYFLLVEFINMITKNIENIEKVLLIQYEDTVPFTIMIHVY